MKGKIHKTTFTVVILSDEPLEDSYSLSELDYMITHGDCSGVVSKDQEVQVIGKDAVKEIVSQGSDPRFFGMDYEGNSLDDY